jgi:hypothetical protein
MTLVNQKESIILLQDCPVKGIKEVPVGHLMARKYTPISFYFLIIGSLIGLIGCVAASILFIPEGFLIASTIALTNLYGAWAIRKMVRQLKHSDKQRIIHEQMMNMKLEQQMKNSIKKKEEDYAIDSAHYAGFKPINDETKDKEITELKMHLDCKNKQLLIQNQKQKDLEVQVKTLKDVQEIRGNILQKYVNKYNEHFKELKKVKEDYDIEYSENIRMREHVVKLLDEKKKLQDEIEALKETLSMQDQIAVNELEGFQDPIVP